MTILSNSICDLVKIKTHNMDLPDGVLAYYLLNCANMTDEQTSLCRATCTSLTYKDMKVQIERVSIPRKSTSNGSSANHITVEPQYVASDIKDGYAYSGEQPYYEEDFTAMLEDEHEHDEETAEHAFYNRHVPTYKRPIPQPRSGQRYPKSSLQKNPPDEHGNPTPCRFCSSIYHWVECCPDAPLEIKGSGPYRGGGQRHGTGYFNRGRGQYSLGRGSNNAYLQF